MTDGEVRDIVDDLAFPLPSAVICELLGIDTADRAEVREQTLRFSAQDIAAGNAVIEWFRGYMSAVLADRVPDADGDLFMSVPTVKSHLTHAYAKLGLASRAELIAAAAAR